MDKALFTAMTGAKHNMLAQAVRSNNMANVNTTGFRGDFAQARSMPIYGGDGHPTRAFSLTESPATNFAHGALIRTGGELDVAIEGDGFLALQAPDGSEVYSRAGNLSIDRLGILRAGNGFPVMGNGGPITIPPSEKIEIAVDGTITSLVKGQGADSLAQVNRLKLVNPEPGQLFKGEDGLLRMKDGAAVQPDAGMTVVSGFLESSNVNVIDEFTEIMSLSRQYEMQVKLMKTVEENSESSAQLLRIS